MSDTLNRLAAVVGDKHAIREPSEMDGYMREWRQIWTGRSPLVLRPGSTGEVSRILATPEVKTIYANAGMDAVNSKSPEEFANYIDGERAKWARVIKAAKLRIE